MVKIIVCALFTLFSSQLVAQNMRNMRTAQATKIADSYYANNSSKFWIHTSENATIVKEWLNNAWVDAPVQAIEHDSRNISLVDGRNISFEKDNKIIVIKAGVKETFDLDNSLRAVKN